MNVTVRLTDLSSEFPVVTDADARGLQALPRLSVVLVVADVACLEAVQLRRTALVRLT
jgi:hypothetical protein